MAFFSEEDSNSSEDEGDSDDGQDSDQDYDGTIDVELERRSTGMVWYTTIPHLIVANSRATIK